MKRYFITGLVILLPLAITFAIVLFVFNLLTVPFLGIVKTVFDHYNLFNSGFLFLHPDQIQTLIAQFLILISLFFFAIGLGLIARWFFFKSLIRLTEYIFKHIPLVSAIYKTCQEVIKSLFSSTTQSFKQVVLVPFPHADSYAIGFITREEIAALASTHHADTLAVFIPTAPNPISGFLVMYKPIDLIYLDMKVEEAFKYVISCGVISPTSMAISKEEVIKRYEQESKL